jgi:misacylated tRNA(Ala) deacylase
MPAMPATEALYLDDDHCVEAAATIVAVAGDALACDRTCFYPGGGGQPADQGTITLGGGPALAIISARADDARVVWHVTGAALPTALVGRAAHLRVDAGRRLALARYHTVLHVLNTVTLRDYGGWITGVQIGVDGSRIDFKLEGLTPALCAELEAKVNAVLAAPRAIRSFYVSEAEFRARDDLRRTLTARPPVFEGRVRVVEIERFDAQACGGTHVSRTADVGHFSIVRTENKGRINKRLYVHLATSDGPPTNAQVCSP